MKRTFRQEGNKLVIKNIIDDTRLETKEVLDSIIQLEGNINNAKQQVEAAKKQIEGLSNQLLMQNEDLKNIKKHEEWARKIQASKFKAILEEVSADCEKKVLDTYKQDDTMTKEQNKGQMFVQFKQYVATHKKMNESINNNIIQQSVWQENILVNPFKA